MEKQIKTIGVLTSGGDAPGMNAAVRAVVRTGLHKGFRMIGIQRGYNGLLNGECFEMNLRSVSNIISAGGTILYTARCLEFKTKEGQDKGAAKCRELGYVEPEEEVYRRFAELAEQTADGLQTYGILDPADRENLTRLASLARSLETISRKELQNERLSDEEYDLIREYGGTLEHFWIEAVKDRTDAEYLDAREIPASLVTDIATDPNGTVLQAANGRPAQIYVIVPVEGALRIASGVVYNFYQFCQPLSARLTDSEWRQMIGEWMSPDGRFHQDETPEKPWWTQSYWVQG